MEDNEFYIVYRIYDDNERIYGWTHSKKVLKAFLSQRSKKKYRYYKLDGYELGEMFSCNSPPEDGMIDYIRLLSNQSSEKVIFFTTANELKEIEIKIERLFGSLCSLANISKNGNDLVKYVGLITNLRPEYADALYDVGYRPIEIDEVYESADDSLEAREYEEPTERWTGNSRPSRSVVDDIFKVAIYSFESFIKVLKDDL